MERMERIIKMFGIGKGENHSLEDGRTIQVLPSCTVPFNNLLEENWDYKGVRGVTELGKFRFVKRIGYLKDGTPSGILQNHLSVDSQLH